MMKRVMLMLLAVVMLMMPLSAAGAEMQAYTYQDMFIARDILPLEDGSILMSGRLILPDQVIEEPEEMGYEVMPERQDAFAVCIDSEGNKLWHIRITDPQSLNEFSTISLLPDGRFLLQYRNFEGTFGTQYFIVSREGKVEGMLPSDGLRKDSNLTSLYKVTDGFVAGGFTLDFDTVSGMTKDSAIVKYDDAMQEAWRLQGEELAHGFYMTMREAEDGYYFLGSLHGQYTSGPSVMKISKAGEFLWRFEGHKYAASDFSDGWALADGGIILTGTNDPTQGTPNGHVDEASLTKLDKDGNHVWTKGFGDQDIKYFSSVRPFEDGFVALGVSGEDYRSTTAVYISTEGELKGTYSFEATDTDASYESSYYWLGEGLDGNLYLYGNLTKYTDEVISEDYSYSRISFAEARYQKLELSLFK